MIERKKEEKWNRTVEEIQERPNHLWTVLKNLGKRFNQTPRYRKKIIGFTRTRRKRR